MRAQKAHSEEKGTRLESTLSEGRGLESVLEGKWDRVCKEKRWSLWKAF